jgi:sensor histidine kinase YesM
MAIGKIKIPQLVFTLIFWVCFLLLPFLFIPHNRGRAAFESDRFISLYIHSCLILAVFYYCNSEILIPKLLAKRKIWLYVLIVVAFFFCFLYFYFLIWQNAPETRQFMQRRHSSSRRDNNNTIFILFSPTFLFLIAFTFSSVSKIISRWFYAEKVKEEISKQQLETELSLLRSQVNPHFLFNTLNSIYSLTLSNNAKASDAVMKLSRIMRYTLEESQSEYVSLTNELAFINSYLELQKLRTTDKVRVMYETDDEKKDVKIPPLLLIPFIENAFKFGVSARLQTSIFIAVHVKENTLTFTCENDIVPNLATPKSTGSGIANVKRRLDLLYGNNYQLNIDRNNEKYRVVLNLTI